MPVAGIHGNPFRQVAILDAGWARTMRLQGMTNAVSVTPASGSSPRDLQRALFGRPGVASVEEAVAAGRTLDEAMDQFAAALRIGWLFALGLAVLMGFNATAINADERRREHATMFAFGLGSPTVLRLSILENLALGILATATGLALGLAIVGWVIGSLVPDTFPDLGIEVALAAPTLIAAAAAGLLALALVAALHAAPPAPDGRPRHAAGDGVTTARAIALLGFAVAVTGAPPTAHAQWTPPASISDPAQVTQGLRLVSGTDGRVLVAWAFRQPSGLAGFTVASRRPDGRWGPQRTLGALLTSPGSEPRRAGVGEGLLDMAPYGRDRWVGLAVGSRGRRQVLEWWEGTTAGGARRGGTLPGAPWETGEVAAGSGGGAVVAFTTMQPRRGAGSNLRPRVVVVARRAAAGRPFSRPRRVSPLPPPPPYGQGRGPALSATAVTIASGGRRTVAVAWHRRGTLEARISRDGGRTFGPVRRIGPCPEPFPRIALRVSANGEVLVVWGARERRRARHVLVYRMARSPRPRGGSAPFSTELRPALIERTEPIVVPFPVADQYGPPAAAAFAAGSPLVAWQGVDAGQLVVRVARPDAPAGGRQTLPVTEGQTPVLSDLLVAGRRVRAGLARRRPEPVRRWHGRIALGAAGGPLGAGEVLPGEARRPWRPPRARPGRRARRLARREPRSPRLSRRSGRRRQPERRPAFQPLRRASDADLERVALVEEVALLVVGQRDPQLAVAEAQREDQRRPGSRQPRIERQPSVEVAHAAEALHEGQPDAGG